MPQHVEEVAARLAVDGAFRERCRQRLQAAVSVGSGSGDKGDVLGRVRRLNEYLATVSASADTTDTFAFACAAQQL